MVRSLHFRSYKPVVFLYRVVPPSVMWAQRSNIIFLTICLEDCKNPEIKIDNEKIYFHGIGGTEKKKHEVTIPLFKEIDPEVRYFGYIHFVNMRNDKHNFRMYLFYALL